jgi:hypothetical protein
MTDQERTYMRFNSHLSNDQETEAEFKQRAADWHARMEHGNLKQD